jgi:hypothetical protein
MYASALGIRGLFNSTPTLVTGTTSIAELEDEVIDQTIFSGCEGASSGMAVSMAFKGLGSPLPWFPSMDGIYRDARCQERAPRIDGSFPALADEGCMTSDIITILQTCGIRPMGPRVGGVNCDFDSATINAEPRLDQLDAEALTSVLVDPGAFAVDLRDLPTAFAVIQKALALKYPVRLDIIADTYLQNYFSYWTPATKPLSGIKPNDPTAGGHAIVLDGMLVKSDGSIVFDNLNSWGHRAAPSLDPNCVNKAGHFQGDSLWFKQAVMQATIFKCGIVQS